MVESQYFRFDRATERQYSRQRGAALVSTLILFSGIAGLVYATTAVSTLDVKRSRRALDGVKTRQVAESGLELGMHYLSAAITNAGSHDPLSGIENLFGGVETITPFLGEPLMDGTQQLGAVSVSVTLDEVSATSCLVTIVSSGYLPDAPANLDPGERVTSWSAVSTVVEYELAPSEVFNNGYFINNWGWFYGSTIECNGNARSNGQFDAAGYTPTVTGQPIYDAVDGSGGTATLTGYQDDNGDGLSDGNDGGIFSGWDIVGAQNVQGNGGNAINQHDFDEQVAMPNLSDLSAYEEQAIAASSSISIGGVPIATAVYGDDAGELGNLYLNGTAANPIVIDGPVVVQGNVIVSGYVTGQGAIYASGNVYLPDSVQYVDPPATTRPADNTQAATEQWLSDNWDKDFLGLFAAENVVVGDHTDSLWRHYVGGWMNSSLNQSAEDAGEDGIPNTYAGQDGVVGTADDDVLEGDGVFTVELYTAEDDALGLIPPGSAIGDVIPGTGEDIDGDGVYDGTTTLADLDFTVALDTANWGGNMPVGGIADYGDISTLYANTLDAVFYTNHSFCYLVLGGTAARINGALVSRNENVVYGTPSLEVNYDCRLLGGASGMAGGLLPKVMAPPVVRRWTELDRDPNRYLVNP